MSYVFEKNCCKKYSLGHEKTLYQKTGGQEGKRASYLYWKSHSEGVINFMPEESVKYYMDSSDSKNCCPQNDAILPKTNLATQLPSCRLGFTEVHP